MKNNSIKINKEFIILLVAFFIFLLSLIFNISYRKIQNGIPNIYYRIYTKKYGWSKWYKNGQVAGNGIDNITNIEVHFQSKEDDTSINYSFYSKNKWKLLKTKNSTPINGIKASMTNEPKYNIYYRTYNEKDKWFEWATDGEISGNKKKSITKIQIKTILLDSSRPDHLKDFGIREIKNKNF